MSAERMAEIAERVADAKESYLYRTPPQWLADLRWLLDRVREMEGDRERLRRAVACAFYRLREVDERVLEDALSDRQGTDAGEAFAALYRAANLMRVEHEWAGWGFLLKPDAARSPSGEAQP